MSLLSGTISWFGGPGDKTTGPTTASGASTAVPGIAVYNRATLGGWWLLKMPNGKLTTIQQTDLGPAPSTGRKFDFTYSALGLLGYSTKNFPTNASIQGVYLGKTKPEVQKAILPAAQSLGANVPNIAGWLQLVSNRPQFGVSSASGSMVGPFSTGAVDLGNSAVQSSGPPNPTTNLSGSLSDLLSGVIGDAKYAAVLVLVLLVGGALIFHGLIGFGGGGGDKRIVPVPV